VDALSVQERALPSLELSTMTCHQRRFTAEVVGGNWQSNMAWVLLWAGLILGCCKCVAHAEDSQCISRDRTAFERLSLESRAIYISFDRVTDLVNTPTSALLQDINQTLVPVT
jgi:hypothetical protein